MGSGDWRELSLLKQQFSQADCRPVSELTCLEAARESVGEKEGVWTLSERGEEVVFGHLDRDVVVTFLDAEVSGQTTAASQRGHRGTGCGEQGGVGVPAEDGGMMSVWLGDDFDT